MPSPVLIDQKIIDAQSTLNYTSAVIDRPIARQLREVAFYVEFSAGTSAGTLTVESAYDRSYAGTWAPETTIPWTAASSCKIVRITGIHGAIRLRISTAIVGGTVTVNALGN